MRPPPRTHVFLYMFSKGARKYQEISGRNRKKQEETGRNRKYQNNKNPQPSNE